MCQYILSQEKLCDLGFGFDSQGEEQKDKVKRVSLESFPGSPPFILSPSLPFFSTSFLFPPSHPQSYSLFQASLMFMILLLQHHHPPSSAGTAGVYIPSCSVSSVWGGHNENLWWQEIQDSHSRARKLNTCILGRLGIPRIFPTPILFPVHIDSRMTGLNHAALAHSRSGDLSHRHLFYCILFYLIPLKFSIDSAIFFHR